MTVLDTDFMVALLRGSRDAVRAAPKIASPSTTIINVFELYYGAEKAMKPARAYQQVNSLLASLEILNLDGNACSKAAHIHASLSRKGKPVGITDALIAGITIIAGETILTRNVEHFSLIEGLRWKRW
jgi:predicted nucleic acid-binding protein